MSVLLTAVLISLAVVVVARVFWHHVWQRAARTARTYLLVPCGTRPDDLADVGTSVAAALGQCSSQRHCGVVVHRFRDDQMVRTALTVYGHSDPDRIATQIAGAIRATSQPAHDLDLPSDPTHVHYVRRLDYRGRDPNDGELPAPSTAADWISTLLGGGSHGVCLSVVLEPAGRWDRRQLRRWHMARAGRSDDMEGVGPGRAIKTSIVTFDPSGDVGTQVTGGITSKLHRWPFNAEGRRVSSARTYTAVGTALAVPALPVLLLSLRGGFGALVALPAALTLTIAGGVALALAVVCQLFPGAPVNRQPHTHATLHLDGLVPVERTGLGSPARTARSIAGLLNPLDHNMQMVGHQRALGYPFRPTTLVVNAHQAALLLALPSADDTATQRSTATDAGASAELVTVSRDTSLADGSRIGRDRRGNPIRLLDTDRKHGVFIVGEAGSGKSVATLRVFQQDAAARLDPHRARRDGRSALIWIETKGGGADQAEAALRAVDYGPGDYLRIDVKATAGPRLELLDHDDRAGSADRFVGALTYAFETGSVGPRAAEALQVAINLAMHVTPQIADAAGLGSGRPNIVWITVLLLAVDTGQGPKTRLLNALKYAARQDLARIRNVHIDQVGSDDALFGAVPGSGKADARAPIGCDTAVASGSSLYDAVRAWLYYETSFTRSRWAEVFESPRNKLSAVGRTVGLFTPDDTRDEVTFADILDHHGVLILNVGASPHGRPDDLSARRLAAICLYLLWQDIQRTCTGWLDHGRSIGIYADELAALSGTGSGHDVIRELRDLGRAYGLQPVFATQRLSQLPDRTIATARGFGTRLFFQTESIDAALDAVTDLNGARPDGRWTVDDLRGLAVGQAIARLRLHSSGLPPFVLQVDPPDSPPGRTSHPGRAPRRTGNPPASALPPAPSHRTTVTAPVHDQPTGHTTIRQPHRR